MKKFLAESSKFFVFFVKSVRLCSKIISNTKESGKLSLLRAKNLIKLLKSNNFLDALKSASKSIFKNKSSNFFMTFRKSDLSIDYLTNQKQKRFENKNADVILITNLKCFFVTFFNLALINILINLTP